MSEDLAHDAHLRAALRHAPDHALAPPSGLSQTILAAARQAHRPVRPTVAPPPPVRKRVAGARPLRAWLRRLFAPRWAGAWATALVATLGLGLWLDLEPQPAVERPGVVAMSSTPPETTAQAEAARVAASSDEGTTEKLAMAAAKVAPAPAVRAPEGTDARAKQRAAPSAQTHVGEGAAVRRKEMATSVEQQRAAESSARVAAARQDAAEPQPAPPAVANAPGSDRSSDSLAIAGGRVAAPAAAPPPAAPVAELAKEATRLHAALPDARKVELGEAVAVASPALTLLRRTQAELANGSAVWTWGPPGSAAMVPFDAAARAWLSRVVQGARGRWVDVGERGESLAALEVRWWRDGWPHATLRIEANGLRWIEPSGRIRYAPLDATTLQQLRSF